MIILSGRINYPNFKRGTISIQILTIKQTKPFIKKFSESGLLDKLTIKGIKHQQTLDELHAGLMKQNGSFIVEDV